MNRDSIDWLETIPCNRKPQKANKWISEWAPLPEHVDTPLRGDPVGVESA